MKLFKDNIFIKDKKGVQVLDVDLQIKLAFDDKMSNKHDYINKFNEIYPNFRAYDCEEIRYEDYFDGQSDKVVINFFVEVR